MAVAAPAAALTEHDVALALRALGDEAPQPAVLERAYVTLHGRLRKAYAAAFRSQARAGKGYAPTFTREVQARSATLQRAPIVLNHAVTLEDLCAGLAADIAAAPELYRVLAARWPPSAIGLIFLGQSTQQAGTFLRDAAGPFDDAFARYARTAIGHLDALRRGRRRPAGPVADSPLLWLQVALCQLLAAPLALQCVVAALPARELYEIDGNAGARAAVTKLGSGLADAGGAEADDSDLLGLRAIAGSLESYARRVWASLGIAIRSPTEPEVVPFAQLATRLVDAELREPQPRGLAADCLDAWGEREGNATLEVPRHLPAVASGARLRFAPTWPAFVPRAAYTVGSKREIMHSAPGAQLGLFVACSLYGRASRLVVPSGDAVQPLLPPAITAGCLQFGGAHPPHQTHRSGAEADIDLELRNLERFRHDLPRRVSGAGFELDPSNPDAEFWVDFNKSFLHRQWRAWLQTAIAALVVDPEKEPFRALKRPPFDHYGSFDENNEEGPIQLSPNDDPKHVAQARALCLSLLLSGTSRVLFADPWVFIDAFHRLRGAWTDFSGEAASAGLVLPRPFGWPSSDAVVLELFAHYNHWHAEWKHRPGGAGTRAAGPDLVAWAPVWKALRVDLASLTALLAEIAGASAPDIARSAVATSKALTDRWTAVPSGLPDLYTLVFDGASEGDRELLRDTAHTGEP